jgi:chromosome segregation ATPase
MAEANQMAASDKADLFKKMREATKLIEVDFQEKKPAMDELLREAQGKNDSILDLLKNRIRQLESEKGEAVKRSDAIIDDKEAVEEKVKNLLAEKAEMEKRVAEVQRNAEAVASETAALKEELDRAIVSAEQAEKEKNEVQSKLVQLQENWEKYVAD